MVYTWASKASRPSPKKARGSQDSDQGLLEIQRPTEYRSHGPFQWFASAAMSSLGCAMSVYLLVASEQEEYQ